MDYFTTLEPNFEHLNFSTDIHLTTTPKPEFSHDAKLWRFWIGVSLSVFSSLFIGASFIIKKKALLQLSKNGKRANAGGYGYLKSFIWWAGLLSMAIGEAANFIAYAFAPASLVSTLGVLSVLVTTILSTKFLNERLNFLGKMGCWLCGVGSVIIVIHAPTEQGVTSMHELQTKLSDPLFIIYVILCVALSAVLIYYLKPKYKETSTRTLLIWIGVCSLIGSLSVMATKGVGLALSNTIGGIKNEFTSWLTWFCIVSLVVTVAVQMNFLNKSLDTFNTAVVTPIYYVVFTTCVITASAILFREFAHVSGHNWIGLLCGFAVVLTAIVLLHLCKKSDISLTKLTQNLEIVAKTEDEPEEILSDGEKSKTLDSGDFLLKSSNVDQSYGTKC